MDTPSANEPLVSIVTPTFNAEQFISDCIESVLGQSYPHVEHIVQDGASSDSTVDVLRQYGDSISWISEPDQGQSDGLDRALKRSRGDYILVLNADDELLPDAAGWAVRQMRNYPDDAVIYGDVILIDEQGDEIGHFTGPGFDFPAILCVERVIPAQAAFIRRTALDAVGLGADPSLDTCPDFEMFVRLGRQFPMRHVSADVVRYRYILRPFDGDSPRTVDRFVEAKSIVINRVLDDPTAPRSIRRLRRRAMTGLYLWASQEARGMGDLALAWRFYRQAVSQIRILGAPLRWFADIGMRIHQYRLRRQQRPRPFSLRPNWNRAVFVGAGLWQDTVAYSRPVRILSTLSSPFRWLTAQLSAIPKNASKIASGIRSLVAFMWVIILGVLAALLLVGLWQLLVP